MGFEMSFENLGGGKKEVNLSDWETWKKWQTFTKRVEKNQNDPEKRRLDEEKSKGERLMLNEHRESATRKGFELCAFMIERFKNDKDVRDALLKNLPGYRAQDSID